MKVYEKMKAVVVDLSEVLDEVISFDVYAAKVGVKAGGRKLAYAHYADARRDAEEAQWIASVMDGDTSYDPSRFTVQEIS